MKWFPRIRFKKKKEEVPAFLVEQGYSFDGSYKNTDKYLRILPIDKTKSIAPGITSIQPTFMVLLAEKNRKTKLFRFGMRIDEREIISPEMEEKDFAGKLIDFQNRLQNKTEDAK